MALSFLAFKNYFVTLIYWLTVETKEIPRLLIFSLALVPLGVVAQTDVEPPRTIRVVMDNLYAPYVFQSVEGMLQGILIDQWQAWEKKTGIKAEIHAMDWDEALQRMRAGEFDVIDSIVETAERQDYFDFTPAYATVEASIYFRNDISGITDLASLKGFPVAVKTGDQHIDKLKANGVTSLILFQNNDAIIEAAKEHTINVFVVDDPSALYLLNKMDIEAEFRHSAPVFRDELRRAVRKGDAATLRTVSEGFAAIEPGELKQIDEKWFGRTINWYGRYLTYAGYAAAVAILLIAGLSGWNRTLRKGVLQRTAALRASELRFREMIAALPVAVYVVDSSGLITHYNRRAVELWGREPLLRDPAARYCGSLRLYQLDGTLLPHSESPMSEVLRTGTPAHNLEVIIERPAGSRVTVTVSIAALRNEQGELVGAINCFQDITARKQAEVEQARLFAQLQRLSRQLLQAQEAERRSIARELHDEIGQRLTGLGLLLSTQHPAPDQLTDAQAIVRDLIARLRNLSLDLRPTILDDLGLLPALVWLFERYTAQTNVAVRFEHRVQEEQRFDPDVETSAYRIVQEALTNVARHAGVPALTVRLWMDVDTLWVVVADQGRGFDRQMVDLRSSSGLTGMQERAALLGGSLTIEATSGSGTRLTATLPLHSGAGSREQEQSP
jgi:signal transduction histidine kinase/ABC-type amino acid transport substrate-binding protein